MTGVTLTAALEDGPARAALRQVALIGRSGELLRAIGTGLARNARERFDDERDPRGMAWQPLSELYAPIKKGPGILRESGMRGGLQGSITFDATMDEVAVGSNKVYAAVHQFGATIRPKNGPHLIFRNVHGLVFAKSVTIDARPYLGISTADEDTILDAAEAMWQRATGGRG